ncbi:MAG: glycosyltransferase family 4 protein [Acidimicrobiales bacterium]|jgi:glycosyltransferase involved in cell wall biosynthesis
MTDPGPDLRIALYSGIFVHHDAVSNSLQSKVEILESLGARGARIDLTVFTHASDYRAPYIRGVPTVADLLRQEAFWSADVHIFEFGMSYELFDSVFVIPPDRPIMVVEHNTTPPELVDDPAVKLGCEAALVQRHNISRAYRVACASELNLDLDLSIGVEEDRLCVLHLPPAHRLTPVARKGFGDNNGPVHLLYLGRLVRAKGVGDLLKAVSSLWGCGDDRFVLTLAGNPRFSDEMVLRELHRCMERFAGLEKVQVVSSPSDEDIVDLFHSADVLVIPSYHEGYCVPVIEALSAGCYVIGSDAGNLPNVMGGLGRVVPTGDVPALTAAIADFVSRLRPSSDATLDTTSTVRVPTDYGELDYAAWLAVVAEHLEDYSDDAYERGFIRLLAELAAASPAGLSQRLGDLISERTAELTRA